MCKRIDVYNGYSALVDDADFPHLSQKRWHLAGHRGTMYVTTSAWVGGKCVSVPMHTLIASAPLGMVVDHVNGNRLDNRRSNLRICTRTENLWNRHAAPRGVSRFSGVTYEGNRWRARISRENHRINIGVFAREVDAAIAYDAKCRALRGEFARPNFSHVVPRSRLRELLSSTGGRFFTVCFIKRTDGSERIMRCRTGVSPLPGPSIVKIQRGRELVSVWDAAKRAFRYIPLEGILWIRFEKAFIRPIMPGEPSTLDVTTQGQLFAQTAG